MSSSSSADVDGGRAWVARVVEESLVAPVGTSDRRAVVDAIRAAPTALQIGILRACVERMPALRRERTRSAFAVGEVLYTIAVELYAARLPLREADICALLRTSTHDCGHGADVMPPVELALRHARRHGLSTEMAAAVRAYRAGMRSAVSVQAQAAKRKAGFLALLVPSAEDDGTPECWSDRLGPALAGLPAAESVAMQRAVLHMAVNDGAEMPAAWAKQARALVQAIGPAELVAILKQLWPRSTQGEPSKLQTPGSHALKNFVWLLGVLAECAPEQRSACDALVLQLAAIDWRPRRVGLKVVVVAAYYLAARPGVASIAAVRRLESWANEVEGNVKGHPASLTHVRRALATLEASASS